MEIEEPENPINIPSDVQSYSEGQTIGEFYNGIITLMTTLEQNAQSQKPPQTIFTGNPANQVTFPEYYPANVLFPVTDLASATNAINIIIDQGEGSSTDPFVEPGDSGQGAEPAHYYRFEQIVLGKTLVQQANGSYAFNGPPIPFDPTQVINMWPNPTMSEFPKGTLAYENCRLFNYNYTSLLNSLHDTFNGQPQNISTALGVMFSLRLYAVKLLAQPHPLHPGFMAGPSFEYQPTL